MLTDEQLFSMSAEVDNFILTLAKEYETPSLELSAVILARLLLLNVAVDQQKDFKQLLNSISEKPMIEKQTKTKLH